MAIMHILKADLIYGRICLRQRFLQITASGHDAKHTAAIGIELSIFLLCAGMIHIHTRMLAILIQAMNFIDDIARLYREISRVLVPGGTFIFGVANPVLYIFDEKVQTRRLKVKYTLPFSHGKALSDRQLKARLDRNDTLEFSHTLDSVLGGLVASGFSIDGFFTDSAGSEPTDSFIFDSHLAVKVVLAKPLK